MHQLRTNEVSDRKRDNDESGLRRILKPGLLNRMNNINNLSLRYSLNLYELIKKNSYQGFSLSLIRRFANSLISCLRLLYRENIIHCDLKPVGFFTQMCDIWPLISSFSSLICVVCYRCRRTCCWNNEVAAPSKSSISVPRVTVISASTRTYSRGFTGVQKWFLVFPTARRSICGVWAVSWPSYTRDIRCFRARMR